MVAAGQLHITLRSGALDVSGGTVRVTMSEQHAKVVHVGCRVEASGPMLLLDGRQIARRRASGDGPWIDKHGREWGHVEVEVAP